MKKLIFLMSICVLFINSIVQADDVIVPDWRGQDRTVHVGWDYWGSNGNGPRILWNWEGDPNFEANPGGFDPLLERAYAHISDNVSIFTEGLGRLGVLEVHSGGYLSFGLPNYNNGTQKMVLVQVTWYGGLSAPMYFEIGSLPGEPNQIPWPWAKRIPAVVLNHVDHNDGWTTCQYGWILEPNPLYEGFTILFSQWLTDDYTAYIDQVVIDTICPGDIKWSQRPVQEPNLPNTYVGWDEEAHNHLPRMVADDFLCDSNKPVTAIRWWGSLLGWDQNYVPLGELPDAFYITIWSDVPDPNPGDPNTYSHPDKIVWQNYCDSYDINFYGWEFDPNNPYDPCEPGDTMLAKFEFYQELDPCDYWYQINWPIPPLPRVYWLGIMAIYNGNEPNYPWGWETREHFFNDDAVRFFGYPVAGVNYPAGDFEPIKLQSESWDLSFELLTFKDPTTKYAQNPDLRETGIDVDASRDLMGIAQWYDQLLADDFPCTVTEPITEIHIWGSWYHDELPAGEPNNVDFKLSIHADLPVGDPCNPYDYSIPGEILWMKDFTPGQFEVAIEAQNITEGYYVPCEDYYEPNADWTCWRYDFSIDPCDAFIQQGDPCNPVVYWLDVQALTDSTSSTTRFGWKTSLEHWNDDAVWTQGTELSHSLWQELQYPTGHLLEGNSIDLAFAIGKLEPLPSPVVYVDVNALGNNDGSSWYDAYNYLQNALADPCALEIWVADGTYKPDQGAGQTPGDRSASFTLKNGVSIYGGYAGCGAQNPDERDIDRHETILSGDLAGNDVYVSDPCDLLTEPSRAENSYHVVDGSNTDATAIIDGFTITAGNADNTGVSPQDTGGGMLNSNSTCTINKCKFIENSASVLGGAVHDWLSNVQASNCTFIRNAAGDGGGGMSCVQSNPTILNCVFILNKGISSGSNAGGVYDINSDPNITNCLFSNNSAVYGGAVSNIIGSDPTITNCTFSANWASSFSGAINDYNNSNPIINNCIFWDNNAPAGAQIGESVGSAATVNYSDVQGGWSGPGVGNIDEDPCFVEPVLLDPTKGMISYWKLDEGSGTTASDSVNGNNGTISGATWTTGKVGPALYFHGGGQWVNGDSVMVPHSSNLDITGLFTVEAWIKATGTDHYLMIVDKFYDSETSDSNGFSFYISGGKLRLSIYSGANGQGNVEGTSELRDDAWHHVAALWDGSYGEVYVDGVSEGQSSWPYPPASTTYSLAIGKRPCGWGGYLPFLGTIDEVAIYDRVLDSTEIKQHYQNGLAGCGYIGTIQFNYRLRHNSPCIDVGDNSSVPPDTADLDHDSNTAEPTLFDLDGRPRFVDGDCNGTVIVDMGAYEFAYAYIGDFDGDCDVDFFDFAILASYWLQDNTLVDIAPPPAGDGIVDKWDLAVLCDNWLAGL